MFILLLFLTSIYLTSIEASKVDPEKCEVFGPGLEPHTLTLPVQYFFINVVDEEGNRLNASVGSPFSIQVEGETVSGTYCRVWSQVLDRFDGSYIVRYRVYQTCRDTRINVLFHSRHVGASPYKINEPIYGEDCNCPLPSVDDWMQTAKCSQLQPQIEKDLLPFQSVDFNEVIREAKRRFDNPEARSFCHYVLKENKVYRNCYGKHIGFNMFVDNVLLSLARKMVLPDTEFLINLGDWPLAMKKESPLPMFSWCGSEDTYDIVLPTYDIMEATLEMMGRVTLDLLSVQSNNKIPWSDKKASGFWRGRDSRQERLDLVKLARQNPLLLNASLTNFFFFRDQEKEFGPKEKHASFFDFFDYKYQINIDGTVAAYRLPYLLGGSGVVFKQDSPYYEHFYSSLEPYVHYIPFKRDLSDLLKQIQWAIDNDSEALSIGHKGREFTRENLMPVDVFCYHASLIRSWTGRLSKKVVIVPGMECVEQQYNEKRFGDCKCHRINRHEEL